MTEAKFWRGVVNEDDFQILRIELWDREIHPINLLFMDKEGRGETSISMNLNTLQHLQHMITDFMIGCIERDTFGNKEEEEEPSNVVRLKDE